MREQTYYLTTDIPVNDPRDMYHAYIMRVDDGYVVSIPGMDWATYISDAMVHTEGEDGIVKRIIKSIVDYSTIPHTNGRMMGVIIADEIIDDLEEES